MDTCISGLKMRDLFCSKWRKDEKVPKSLTSKVLFKLNHPMTSFVLKFHPSDSAKRRGAFVMALLPVIGHSWDLFLTYVHLLNNKITIAEIGRV